MRAVDHASERIYSGVWGALVTLFKVPREAPTLPVGQGQSIESFRPSPGYLRYLKLWFWILLGLTDVVFLILWGLSFIVAWWVGALCFIPFILVAVVPDVIAYVGMHLRVDTTWYVMTDRSIRIRRGIWVIQEATITFENVQNVSVSQGPIQRAFGIADVVIETAGGGGAAAPGKGGAMTGHHGLIQGVANATEIRDRIMARVRASRGAGLGDEARAATLAPDRAGLHASAALVSGLRLVLEESSKLRATLAGRAVPAVRPSEGTDHRRG